MATFSRADAQRFYNRFGAKQDSQAYYEDPATDDLIANADFESADVIVEFGCGTGRFAEKLLAGVLRESARYTGYDSSATMTQLAHERLEAFGDRAKIIETDGEIRFVDEDASVDRVVSNYVLDLLSGEDIDIFIAEAKRVLKPGGRMCLVSLTYGNNLRSKIVSALWGAVRAIRPATVGGCRPIVLSDQLDPEDWEILYDETIVTRGIPSEVLVAQPRTD